MKSISGGVIGLTLAGMLALAGCQDDQPGGMVGTLERDRVELTVESNEPIVRIAVKDGQQVGPGDLVLEQDPTRHQARLDQRLALRDQSAAVLAEMQRGPREELIREARARLGGSEAATVNARQELARAHDLLERGVGQQASVDRGTARMEEAAAREQADRENLERLLAGTTVEELQQAEAALQAAEVAVALARLDLERLSVRASVAGHVDRVQYEIGERPLPGATVAVILDDSRPYARVYVPASLRTKIQPGTTLQVAIDGLEQPVDGTVSWVSADASFTPYFALTEHDRSRLAYLAEIELPQASKLPSGLPLEAWLPTR
jgi:HlyD family secretion protein